MNISERGIELIKHFEGLRLQPYLCPAKVWTQGIGRTQGITSNSPPITEETAEEWLMEDLKRYEASVTKLITQTLSQPQFDALVSFAYNLGGGALQRSTLRQKLNRGDYEGAGKEFYKWVRAGGRVLQGLVLRRSAEANLFASQAFG